MNFLDRAIAVAAPRWGVKRAAARLALEQYRGYDAARRGRDRDGWGRSRGSASSEVAKGGAAVRDAVNELLRNNGYAQKAHRTLVSSSLSTGIVGSPRLIDGASKDAQQKAKDAFDRYVEQADHDGHHDLYGLQVLAGKAFYGAPGEALVRTYRQSFDSTTKVAPIRHQILEPEFIDVSKFGQLGDGGYIDRGIEYDAQGRKAAYWLHQMHPADLSRYLASKFETVRVPIGECEQVFEMLRPGQDRGISIFAGAVLPLKALAEHFEAEAMRKRLESCLSVFVVSDDENNAPLAGTDKDEKGRPLTRISPGMITRLRPGESIETLTPSGFADMTSFADQQLFLAAAAGGVMFEHMTGNMKHMNYSTYRVGSFDFGRGIEQVQWLTLMPRLCRPMARSFMEAGRAAGLLPRELVGIDWTPPAPTTSPDPEKDARADQLNMRSGTLARSHVNARKGWTDAEVMAQIASDLAASDAIGVQFDSDPRKALKAPTPAEPPTPANDQA